MEHFGSHRMDFHEIWYFSIFRKSVAKLQVSFKYDKNNVTGLFVFVQRAVSLTLIRALYLQATRQVSFC